MQRHRLRKGLIYGIALLCLVNTAFGLDPTRRISQYVHDKWGEDKDLLGEEFTPFANRPMVICGLEPKEVWFDSTGPISF
jgi:hypothetical protein